MTKILYIDTNDIFGGGQMHLLRLIEAIDKNRYYPVVLCFNRNLKFMQELKSRGVKFVPIKALKPTFKNKLLEAIFRIPNFLETVFKTIPVIKREKIDIIHANLFYSALTGSVIVSFLKRPLIWTVHIPDDLQKYKIFTKVIGQFVNKVTPTCNHFFKIARKNDWDISKFRTVYSGLNMNDFSKKETPKLLTKGRGIKKPIVAQVARLAPRQKRQQDFIKAAETVLKEIPQANFLIVGGASNAAEEKDKERLEKLIKKKRVSQKIIFTGFFPDLNYLLSNIEVLVLPSLQESIPAIILEAMAMRKPVVATDIGGIPEVVVDGETGFLVPVKNPGVMAEKIIFLLKNPEKAKEMGRKGYIRVKKYFSQERMAKEYERIYEEMLQK